MGNLTVAHTTAAFEVFHVRAKDAIEAKRILIEDGHISRTAAVVSNDDVRRTREIFPTETTVILTFAGSVPTLREFDNMEQFSRGLAYYERTVAAISRVR